MLNIIELKKLPSSWGWRLKRIGLSQEKFCENLVGNRGGRLSSSTLNSAINGRSDPCFSTVYQIEKQLQKMEMHKNI
jgi:hypothetical protein